MRVYVWVFSSILISNTAERLGGWGRRLHLVQHLAHLRQARSHARGCRPLRWQQPARVSRKEGPAHWHDMLVASHGEDPANLHEGVVAPEVGRERRPVDLVQPQLVNTQAPDACPVERAQSSRTVSVMLLWSLLTETFGSSPACTRPAPNAYPVDEKHSRCINFMVLS